MPVILSAESNGNFSMFLKTSQMPTTNKAKGKTKVPQPATWEMDWIHQLVTVPLWEVNNERMVRNPTSARKIPRISSFLSLEILFHSQPDFEEERDLRDFALVRVMEGVFDRDELFTVRDDDLELVLLLLDLGFCAKGGLQNWKVVLIITNLEKQSYQTPEAMLNASYISE